MRVYRKRKNGSNTYGRINKFRRRAYTPYSKFTPRARLGGFVFPGYYADQPARKFVKLKYVDMLTTDTIAANSLGLYQYYANSCYQPKIGGHQPYGFDQLMALYTHFTVVRSMMILENLDDDTNTMQKWLTFTYSQSNTPITAFAAGGLSTVMELPHQSESLGRTTGDHLGRNRSVINYCDMTRFTGMSVQQILAEKDLSGTNTTNPAKLMYFGVVGYEPSLVSGAAHQLKVTIIFNVVFTEPRYFVPS